MRSMQFALAAVSVMACSVDSDSLGTTTQNTEIHNKLASNKLASNKLASNKLASNKLASNSLSSTRLVALAETADLLQTADGREVYSYIVSCALADGMTIEADVPGAADTAPDSGYTCLAEHCTFSGGVGLAPRWADHRLDNRGKGWVSACLFARVNFHDTAEAISLRGRNESLTVSQDEAELYGVEEGAFYGNVFTKDDEPIDWNACRGEGQASGEFGGLALRDCTEENPDNPGFTYCGFNYAGDCADYTPEFPTPYACGTFNATQGIYGDCHATAGDGKWPNSQKYREVITTYVTAD